MRGLFISSTVLVTWPSDGSQTARDDQIDPRTGSLDVAGLLLQNKDVEIVVHVSFVSF